MGSPQMSALDQTIDFIKKWEGCRLTAYVDPATGGDPITIGYGATGPGIRLGVTWTQQQADERLAADVGRFMAKVGRLVTRPLEPFQLAALTSFAYNVGTGALADSTLLRKLNAGDFAGAEAQFARWNRAGGRVMAGLTRRRAAEAAMFHGKPS